MLLFPVTCPPTVLSCHLSACRSFLSPVHMLLLLVTCPHAALSCHLSTCCSYLSSVRMLLFPVICPHAALSCHLRILLFPATCPHSSLSCHLSACSSFLSPVWLLVRSERLGGRRGCCAGALNAASRCRSWCGPPSAHIEPQFLIIKINIWKSKMI